MDRVYLKPERPGAETTLCRASFQTDDERVELLIRFCATGGLAVDRQTWPTEASRMASRARPAAAVRVSTPSFR